MSIAKTQAIIKDIKNKNIKPVYALTGEEPYYIDEICDYIEKNVLSEEEKGFNQMILYGRDAEVEEIISHAKRYPMMAERQVVIVKEAQDLKKVEDLADYVLQPQPTTLLVLCYKKKLDKRTKLAKAIEKHGVLFEGGKVYDNQLPEIIRQMVISKGHTVNQKATQMLAEFLGSDLGRISNELEKLKLVLKPGEEISPEIIEENIGISKDFNNFELQNAIGARDIKKAFSIAGYFSENSREHPIVLTLSVLYSFFSKLLIYHALENKRDAAKALGVSPFFIKDYQIAASNYPMKKISAIIKTLREVDMMSKGIGVTSVPHKDLLNEILISVFDREF